MNTTTNTTSEQHALLHRQQPGGREEKTKTQWQRPPLRSQACMSCGGLTLSKDAVVSIAKGLDKAGAPAFVEFMSGENADLQPSFEGFNVIVYLVGKMKPP